MAITPSCHPDRKYVAKGLCKPCYDAEYDRTHREVRNRAARTYRQRHPDRIRSTGRKYRYGVNDVEVNDLFIKQDGMCAACRIAPATDVDHDHNTNVIRGLLCGPCNRALGLFRDNPQIVRQAADYLETYKHAFSQE